MKKAFKRILSTALASAMVFSSLTFTGISVSAAGFSTVGGWNESLYAEWPDSNPDAANVKVEYKLSSASAWSSLEGDDLTYLVRKDGSNGRVDIPGIKAGRYDLKVTASNNTVYERTGIKVYANDRSGYAHWNRNSSEAAYTGVGAYKDDGTPKENAKIIYLTDENKDTVTIPGYENRTWSYTPSSGSPYTRTSEGIGNILNNNMKFIQQVTITDNHPLIIRVVGKVNLPKNLTPYNTKDPILGGAEKDNGNLAITKYGRNITIQGIGDDAEIYGWGFTFSQSKTCPSEAGESFEISNLTFRNYTEDATAFQGDDAITAPVRRIWVHNNTYYPGYCAKPAESDKSEGDGAIDFKRGQYFTLSYNHFVNCHKTGLIGSSDSVVQYYSTLHHNWYEKVEARQPLAAGGNIHIYNTYYDHASSVTVDLRGAAAVFTENNYFDNCKKAYNLRSSTCRLKNYGDVLAGNTTIGSISGTRVVAESRTQSGISDNKLAFPNGDSMKDFDMNPAHFYYANGKTNVEILNDTADVPEYVKTYAGVLKAFPITESGEVIITVMADGKPVDDAVLTGMDFHSLGNGKYSAAAELGVAYDITVSKEGYSNQSFKTDAINEDGGTYEKTINLAADTNGYAAVMLTGGSGKTPVTGATVKISGGASNGVELKDKGSGLYQSDNEIATGQYNVTITNTGDYIAPTGTKTITVRTTNAPTEINLEKYKGTVNVRLSAASGETQPLDVSKAKVSVGNTQLTRSGTTNTFTGQVEVGTLYNVTVSLVGWNTISVVPETLAANKDRAVTANATLKYKGQLFTWNYTDGTNTDNFFTLPSSLLDWSTADDNPQTFEDSTLTKAVKVNSAFTATFEAPADGTLALVLEDAGKDNSSINVNGKEYPFSTGTLEVPVSEGLVTVKKGKNETHLYLMQYAADGGTGGTVTPPTPVEPEDTPAFTVGTVTAPKGGTAVVPVSISGVNNDAGLGFYNITLTYDSSKLKYVKTENNITGTRCELSANGTEAGKVVIAAVNGNDKVIVDDTVLCNVYFTANDSADISIAVTQALGINNSELKTPTTTNGKVTVTQDTGSIPGDADNDGDVDTADAYAVLKYISGVDTSAVKNFTNADCDGKTGIDMADVIWILCNQRDKEPETDTPLYNFDDNQLPANSEVKYTTNSGDANESGNLYVRVENGELVLYDQDTAATASVTVPVTEKNSGIVTYKVDLTPDPASAKWTMVQFVDASGKEIVGVRTQENTLKYGLRQGGVSEPTEVTDVVSTNNKATIILTVDYTAKSAKLTVDNSTTGSVPFSTSAASAIAGLKFQTATGTRNLKVDNIYVIDGEGANPPAPESTTETTTEAPVNPPSGQTLTWNAGDTASWVGGLTGGASDKARDSDFGNGITFEKAKNVKVENGGSFTVTVSAPGTISVYMTSCCNDKGGTLSSDKGTVTAGEFSARNADIKNVVTINATEAGTYTLTPTGGDNGGYAVFRIVYTPN